MRSPEPDHITRLKTKDFLAEQARHGQLVLFVGAGVSIDAGLPSWVGLINPLMTELGVESPPDLLDGAQWYMEARGRDTLVRHVRDCLREVQDPGEEHCALAAIPAPVIFTTNFDQLMEKALELAQGTPPDVIVEDAHVALIDEARRTTVVKLHGCLSLPNSIVLTRDDYDNYANTHRAMIAYLQSLIATRTLLFVGFSLVDPNFRSIHHAISQALGEYSRHAYLLDAKKWEDPALRFWDKRGVRVLSFGSYKELTHFIGELASAAGGVGSVQRALNDLASPPPPIEAQGLVQHLGAIQQELHHVVDQARAMYLPPSGEIDILETVPLAEEEDSAANWLSRKAHALLDLALAVDRLTPIDDPILWTDLGDMLYLQKDVAGAIPAYQAALRPARERHGLNRRDIPRVMGNLARAFADQGHYARAEWLLRRCVFRSGMEASEEKPSNENVAARLNKSHLYRRPSDASRFAYVMSRRAEQLRRSGYFREAFTAVTEARYVLAPVLGKSSNPQVHLSPYGSLFREEGWSGSRDPRRGVDPNSRDSRASSEAYALNYLGKCFKLSCQLALDVGGRHVQYYLERANEILGEASKMAPLLPFSYAHRLELAQDTRVNRGDRHRLLANVVQDLSRLSNSPEGHRLIASLQERFPKLKASLTLQ